MRLNLYIARATGLSRRAADAVVAEGRVLVNKAAVSSGQQVEDSDEVSFDGHVLTPPKTTLTILLNKPAGYVCSRDGQGSKTVYDLLPTDLHHLKPVGRLDKMSSGLLLLSSDGRLANELTHPRFQKTKRYNVQLLKPLTLHDKKAIEKGVILDDGLSHLSLDGQGKQWTVSMQEGRNRQIRRTFASVGYTVQKLHRTHFGPHELGDLQSGSYRVVNL